LRSFKPSGTSADDALGQTFDDCGLADAGLADEDGIVLGAAGDTWMTRRISSSRPITGSIFPTGELVSSRP
jgi:hypothetical protein